MRPLKRGLLSRSVSAGNSISWGSDHASAKLLVRYGSIGADFARWSSPYCICPSHAGNSDIPCVLVATYSAAAALAVGELGSGVLAIGDTSAVPGELDSVRVAEAFSSMSIGEPGSSQQALANYSNISSLRMHPTKKSSLSEEKRYTDVAL